ncbi:response regulator transcription factor [Microbacterium sp. P01]|uniref:response regulator transcription factor n=1 Tax=unclassified Microbacterium TaxID=2609290 RepID=UPI003670CFB8
MNTDENALKTAVIVEDDPDIRHLLAEVLESAGFSTVSVGNGIDGVRAVLTYKPLITTLDVNMPGIDGFEAARRIRAESDTYIIMLTGSESEADVVLALGNGADEYLTKPFRPRELRARIDAALRRQRRSNTPPPPAQERVGPSFPSPRPVTTQMPTMAPRYEEEPALAEPPIEYIAQTVPAPAASRPAATPYIVHPAPNEDAGSAVEQVTHAAPPVRQEHWLGHRDLLLDPDARIVTIGASEVDLTRTEFDLLATLLESKRRVRSKADLTLVLRGESYVTSYFVGDADKRAIEAHMTNLRRKLGDNPNNPRFIETVRGVGYRLTSDLIAAP